MTYIPADSRSNISYAKLKNGGRYFSREFSEFREFTSLGDFISHRFEIWHEETVKKFEEAVAGGKVDCPSCNI